MTRKHFVEIAATIKSERDAATARGESTTALDNAARGLCVTFKTANSAFDRQRFLTACGIA